MQDSRTNAGFSGAELMLRVKQGDASAFNEIVMQYQDDVIGLCFRYVGNQVDAEEVAQEVFVRLYQSRDSYEPRGKLTTYLYRIAVNRSLNFIRNQRRRKWLSFDKVQRSHSLSDPENPESAFERQEQEAMIQEAIQALPKNQKTVLILRRYQELSYEEIAEIMGCSIPSVESRLFRARQTLRKTLKPFI